MNQMP